MAQDKISLSSFNQTIFKKILIGLILFFCFIIFLDSNFSPVKSNAEFINDSEGYRSKNGKERIFSVQTSNKKYRISAQLFNIINENDSLLIYRSKITGIILYYGLRKPHVIIVGKTRFFKDDFFGLVTSTLGVFLAIILYFNSKLAQNVTLQGILVFLIIISLVFLRNYFGAHYLWEF
ncbi:hypothetical protein H9N25_15525 [Pedobacter riviphilus]|uniref:Uncharacterized protein n=1 Tax=Pedobacter riviphilus TaxID=2766984 RepID=A0ABX6TFG7_9SPHI|nr:hypothetical protein [Pedobacter riviphilus]QNR83364.1 hypothetical protein H9N25_15525 [Pedobacter riviphilus]